MNVRKATLTDVPQMAQLVDYFAQRGEILPRPPGTIYESLREWVVAEDGGRIVGCGSLLIVWADLAEIRSLVVAPGMQGRGLGRGMIERLLAEARQLGLPKVFALTRKEGFFRRLGFSLTQRDALPRKVWKDCIHCPKFVGCDEVGVIKHLPLAGPLPAIPAAANGTDARPVSALQLSPPVDDEL
ncbi:MAG: N-acetyltransferase [Anaerolineae bacterium]